MSSNGKGIKRRDFLKRSALTGLGTVLGGSLIKVSYAASRDRVTALSSIGLDSLHPYAHSSSPQYGIWNNMIEPLVEVDYAKKDYFGKALLFTTRSKDLAASVIYYGENPRNLEDANNITAPVLGHYGGDDERITSAVPQLVDAMKKYGKSFEYKVYPGAPHGFNSDTSPPNYREDAAKEAWERTLEFFKKHLQG